LALAKKLLNDKHLSPFEMIVMTEKAAEIVALNDPTGELSGQYYQDVGIFCKHDNAISPKVFTLRQLLGE
jgi:hypothetical protein